MMHMISGFYMMKIISTKNEYEITFYDSKSDKIDGMGKLNVLNQIAL